MKLTEQEILLIEKHLAGVLTPEETIQFEALRRNPSFEEELNFQKDIVAAARAKDREEIRHLLAAEENKIEQHQRKNASSSNRNIRYWIAAAAIAIAILFTFLLRSTREQNQLFVEFYTPYPNTIDPIRKGENPQLSAYQTYELGEYKRAITTFEQGALNDTMTFYLGLSYLGDKKLQEAAELLKSVSKKDFTYEIPAKWYTALIHIRLNQNNTAESLLTEISMSDHPLASRADTLLTRLHDEFLKMVL